jgi:type I restriction enzyme S subunit
MQISARDPERFGLPFVGLEQIAAETGEIDLEPGSRTGEGKSNSFRFDGRHVLYGKLRPYLNKVALPNFTGRCSTEIIPLLPTKELHRAYLAYFLRQRRVINAVMVANTGSRMPRADMNVLLAQRIPLPPLSEQRHIVEILDRANGILRLRCEAQAKMGRLIPALFIEMFGDPATNPKGWPSVKIGNLFNGDRAGIRCGPFGTALKKSEYVADGVPVWGIDNVRDGEFVEEGCLHITEEKYETLKGFSVRSGDVLISRAGTVGRMCVARPSVPESIIGTNLILISLDQRKIVPEYFVSLFTHRFAKVQSLRATGEKTAYSFTRTTILRNVEIHLPPINVQRAFAERLLDVQSLISQQRNMVSASENLISSLMSQLFDGETRAAA